MAMRGFAIPKSVCRARATMRVTLHDQLLRDKRGHIGNRAVDRHRNGPQRRASEHHDGAIVREVAGVGEEFGLADKVRLDTGDLRLRDRCCHNSCNFTAFRHCCCLLKRAVGNVSALLRRFPRDTIRRCLTHYNELGQAQFRAVGDDVVDNLRPDPRRIANGDRKRGKGRHRISCIQSRRRGEGRA